MKDAKGFPYTTHDRSLLPGAIGAQHYAQRHLSAASRKILTTEASRLIEHCPGKVFSRLSCLNQRDMFVQSYVAAMAGSYTSSWEMFYDFRNAGGGVRQSRFLSCAWADVHASDPHSHADRMPIHRILYCSNGPVTRAAAWLIERRIHRLRREVANTKP